MLPSPLHPAVVHFPIVLMFLLPLAALAALWAIRRGSPGRRAWAVPVLVAATLSASAWVAVETGERDEDRAEDVVGKPTIHAHEEAAERFLALSGGVFVIALAGLLGGPVGRVARITGTAAALGLVIAGYQVGHTGGRVVYGDGTARGLATYAAGEGQGEGARDAIGVPAADRKHGESDSEED